MLRAVGDCRLATAYRTRVESLRDLIEVFDAEITSSRPTCATSFAVTPFTPWRTSL